MQKPQTKVNSRSIRSNTLELSAKNEEKSILPVSTGLKGEGEGGKLEAGERGGVLVCRNVTLFKQSLLRLYKVSPFHTEKSSKNLVYRSRMPKSSVTIPVIE